jgi:hypothetical protein
MPVKDISQSMVNITLLLIYPEQSSLLQLNELVKRLWLLFILVTFTVQTTTWVICSFILTILYLHVLLSLNGDAIVVVINTGNFSKNGTHLLL